MEEESIVSPLITSILQDCILLEENEKPVSALKHYAAYFHQLTQDDGYQEQYLFQANSACSLPSFVKAGKGFETSSRELLQSIEHAIYTIQNSPKPEEEDRMILLDKCLEELKTFYRFSRGIQEREFELLFWELETAISSETLLESDIKDNIGYIFRICRQFFVKWHSESFFSRIINVNEKYKGVITSDSFVNFSESLCQMLGASKAICGDDYNELYFLMAKGSNHRPLLEIMRSGEILTWMKDVQSQTQQIFDLLEQDPSIGETSVYNDCINLIFEGGITQILEEIQSNNRLKHTSNYQNSIEKMYALETTTRNLLTGEVVDALDWFIDTNDFVDNVDLVDARNDINASVQFVENLSSGIFSMTQSSVFARFSRFRSIYDDIANQMENLTDDVRTMFAECDGRPESVMKSTLAARN